MTTAERILNLVDDIKAHINPRQAKANNMKKTLAVLGIIGSTAAVGYGVYKAMTSQTTHENPLNME